MSPLTSQSQLADLSVEQKRELLAQLLQKKTPQRFPLSFAQQRLWFLDRLQPGTTVYAIPAVLRLQGELRLPILQRSLQEIVQRHEILRTRFIDDDGIPYQVVMPTLELPLPLIDLSHVEASRREREVRTQLQQWKAQPFDLDAGPLLRSWLIQLHPSEHILVMTIHHIIADYWSLKLFMREIAIIYHALAQEKPAPLPPLPIQYADYAVWQHEQWQPCEASGQPSRLANQLAYWQQQLAGSPPILQLPADFPRPAMPTFRGARHAFVLSPALYTALNEMAQRQQATLFMTLLAGFQALLHRYSEQTDIWVGSTVTHRHRPETQDLIGLFVNNLVFRAHVTPELNFHQLLDQVRDTALNAYSHQDVPFEQVVDALQVERHLSHNALFQVMLILHNTPTESLTLPGLTASTLELEHATSRFDLSLDMYETPDGLSGVVEYSTDLFRADTIARLVGHFETLLTALVANPEAPIGTLPLMSKQERQHLMTAWNRTNADIPEAGVDELIERQTAKTPDAIAVVAGDQRLSYRDLNRQANQLAHWLRQQGVQPGDRIGVCLERSATLIITLVAILKAGGNYLPLDPLYPPQRLRFMIEDANAKLLICESQTYALAAGLSDTVALVDLFDLCPILDSGSTPHLPSGSTPGDLAYLLYTSGSTGQPKGVPIRHRSLTNLLWAMAQQPGLQAQDTLLAVTTLAFDIAALELFLPLIVGARLVIAARDCLSDPQRLIALMRQHSVTAMQATPATWRLLIDNGWVGQPGLKILCGGEALEAGLARELLSCGEELWNLYGPTETTIWSSALRVEDRHLNTGSIPIGPPIANTEFYVLDQAAQPVPIGIAGELYIGGMGLSPGYHQRPDLTQDAFIPHPLTDAPSSTSAWLYKTGDRVRWRADGALAYLGRSDAQVKLRGFRIELGEIEAVLRQHPQVGQAVVSLHQDETLVAYITAATDDAPAETVLRQHLGQQLPAYMVPSAYVVLETFPLTPNGKIDRQALPMPATSLASQVPDTSPRTPTEELVAGIWATVLGRESISLSDDFFETGGHSLLATRVMAQLRQVLGVEMPLRTLFDHPRLADFAQVVATAISGQSAALVPGVRPAVLPLSFGQQRQWMLAQIESDNLWYNLPVALRVQGHLDCDLLAPSLNVIIERHEVLHTSFHEDGGTVRAEIHASVDCTVPVIDLRHLQPAMRHQRVHELAQATVRQPFDLTQAPLWRANVFRLVDDDHILLLTLHHIIADAWSLGILVRELASVYHALSQGQAIALPPLPVQYVDYAIWQRDEQTQTHLAEQLAYWQHQLEGAPPLTPLPTDHPRLPVQTGEGASYRFTLPPDLVQAVQNLSQQHGVTLFMTLLSAFKVLIYRYSGSSDVVVGAPVAERQRAEFEGLIGLFVNTLVLRTDLSGHPSVATLLERVRDVALGAYSHQDAPFEQVIESLPVPRSGSHEPLCQLLFVFHNAPLEVLDVEGLNGSPWAVESQSAKFDIMLMLHPSAEGLQCMLEYRTALFEASTIERMARHLHTVLAGMVAQPQARLSRLPLLSEAEQQRFVELNQTQRAYDDSPGLCVHELFEGQVARTPEATALVYQHQRWSYQDLNTRANQLAHQLQSFGVGPEVPVGICLDRSPVMIAAILAIFKAGGFYVPLDPAYPQERLDLIMQDARMAVLLTHRDGPISASVATIHLDRAWGNTSSDWPGDNPVSAVRPDNLAYVIYTSGSTGGPKGVAIAHHSPVTLIQWSREVFSTEQLRGVLASTSLCFDLSVFEIFVPLSCGGTVILANNALELPELPAAEEVTLLNTVPSAATELLRLHGIPNCVNTVNLAGEPLPPVLVKQLYEVDSIQHVYNLYGPSEDTTYSTYARMDAADMAPTSPIGRPIANTQAFVLDAHLQQVPFGIPGELYLGGDGLARGYWQRPELTASAFIANPFSDADDRLASPVLYKTGDRVRYRADGNLEYLGRLDNQVKVRGFRVELGEIETILLQHPDVMQAVVHLRTDDNEHRRLVAYVVAGETLPFDLRPFLLSKLPDYMVPAYFVPLPELPLLPNGKLHRQALPAPEGQAGSTTWEAARTDVEKQLATIWSELLQVTSVGIHDNFFELGGDSILAIQAIARAYQMGLQFTPRELFQHQTIAELAAIAATRAPSQAEQGLVLGPVPLTPMQHWFFAQQLTHPEHWNQTILLEAHEPLHVQRLEQALDLLLKHHDALRARFTPTDSAWQQVYSEPADAIPLVVVQGEASQRDQVIERTATDLQSSLNLTTGPLLRVAYFDFGVTYRLLLVVHHLLIDGLSWRIVLGDLQVLYEQLEQAALVQLPPKTASMKQWVEHLQDYAVSPALLAERPYWQAIASQPPVALPRDYCDGDNTMATANTVMTALSEADTQRLLHEVPAAYRSTVNDLLLTALVEAMAPWLGTRRLCVELEGHGREDVFKGLNISRTVGWFTTLFPLVLDLTDTFELAAALKHVKETLWGIPHHGLGYGVLRYLSAEADQSLETQAEVRFNYFGQTDQMFPADGPFRPAPESSGASRSPYDYRSTLLEVNAVVAQGQLRMYWTYSEAIHRRATIEQLADAFMDALRQLIQHCLTGNHGGYTPSDFPQMHLSQDALDQLLERLS